MNLQNKGKEKEALSYLHSYTRELSEPLRDFLNEVIGEFGDAPGGSSHHHAYRYGLLIHTAEVLKVTCYTALIMNADPRVVKVAAIMHDWGKIHDYEFVDGALEDVFDTSGRFITTRKEKVVIKRPGYQKSAHLIASYDRWHALKSPAFDNDLHDRVSRCILSHHGYPDWGSVLVPSNAEEWCLHLADMASAQAGVPL